MCVHQQGPRAASSLHGTPSSKEWMMCVLALTDLQVALGQWLLSLELFLKQVLSWLKKWWFYFILFLEKKNPWALDAEDSWSVWDAGRYFFPIALGTKQMGCHLISLGAMDGAFQLLATWPRLLRAKGRISLLSSLSPWSSASWNWVSGLQKAHLSASLWNMQPRTLREKNFQTPSVKYAEGLRSGQVTWAESGLFNEVGQFLTKLAGRQRPGSEKAWTAAEGRERSSRIREEWEESFLQARDEPLLSDQMLAMKGNSFYVH